MPHILFIFLDGVGLGADDPLINPFARAEMPTLRALLDGNPLIAGVAPFDGEQASLRALDASLGVDGMPQSATGQAALLTGINIPQKIGYHYGPKPNPDVAYFLTSSNGHHAETIFSWLSKHGGEASLLSAYPDGYFRGIESGKRLYSAIPQAVTQAGLSLMHADDLHAGRALAADFTGEGWRRMLKDEQAPVYTPQEAGERLAVLATQYDLAFFEYWASDYAGHRQDMDWAMEQLETLDGVLAGLTRSQPDELLVLITSDHGNMEDLSTRRHTAAQVPCLLIGRKDARKAFFAGDWRDLTGVAPAIKRLLNIYPENAS